MAPEVVTLGESMVGLTPHDGSPLESASSFSRFIGGAESNVAIGVAKMGHSAGWISRLGDDVFGKMILAELNAHGVDITRVGISAGDPTAIYFKGRSTGSGRTVVYYRKGSAMSRMMPADLDERYLGAARVLHVSGITLALSAEARQTVHEAVAIAKAHDVRVSFDPNYRSQLWSEAEAEAAFREVLPHVDILITGDDEAALLVGGDVDAGDPDALLGRLAQTGPSAIYLKRGANGASYQVGGASGAEAAIPVDVVDTVGAGDAFVAGVLVGYLEGLAPRETVRLANVMGGLATTHTGDCEGIPDRAGVDRTLCTVYG